jgi:RNA polymerase sigma-70 factor (ECF subfamily)
MNDETLAVHARRGDEAAFAALIENYESAIFNLCYRILGDGAEAEDAAQETFVRAYHHLHDYDRRRSFKTWLFAIASHHCIDRLRRRRYLSLSLEADPPLQHPALYEPAPGPEECMLLHERSKLIQDLLDQLAPKDRTVIVLRYWHDLPYSQIARLTGVTLSAVKSRLHRARLELAQRLLAQKTQALYSAVSLPVPTVGN